MDANESFDWFRRDIKTMSGQRRGKWVTTKGVALFPTVSRNQREYIEKECMLSARTLAGVPIDVNHEVDRWLAEQALWEEENPGLNYESVKVRPPTWGNVIDAEWEDSQIEYVAQLRGEYGEKMIDREILTEEQYVAKWDKKPIRGVSISASYRYASDDEDMLTPLGIKFNRLSLVEDPESPGVVGTSIDLLESYMGQSLREIEVVGALLKSVSPSLFESYRDEVIEPYKEGKPLENKEYVTSPLEMLDYGELHEVEEEEEPVVDTPLEEVKKLAEAMSEDELKQKIADLQKAIDATWNSESEEVTPEDKAEDAAKEEARVKLEAEKEGYQEALNVLITQKALFEAEENKSEPVEKKPEPVEESEEQESEPVAEIDDVEVEHKVEEIKLTPLDFTAFDAKPELAKKTGDGEVDDKIIEVNEKRVADYEANRDKNIVEALRLLDEKSVKLATHQNSVAKIYEGVDTDIGLKLNESLKNIRVLQERLEDKAGVDKVEKLRGTMETVRTKLEEQETRFKESDGELLSIVETIGEVVNTIKEFTNITDDIKASVDDKEAKVVQLKTAVETSNSNAVKLSTKLAELETESDAKLVKLNTTLETANGKTATKLAEFESDAVAKLASLKQALETSESNNKTLTDKLGELETSSTSQLDELKTTLETANENITKLEKTLEDYEELKTQTASLQEKLEAVEKTITDAETKEQTDTEKALEVLQERLENIEETASPDFKSDKEAEHNNNEPEVNEDILDTPTI